MTPRETDNPKDIRMEVRLSAREQGLLDFCVQSLGFAKSEIIRQGIEAMYAEAQRQKEFDDATEGLDEIVSEAEEERANEVYEEAYNIAYKVAYSKEYAELIRNRQYTPSEAEEIANDSAKDIAKEAAKEAVKEFWRT